MKNLKLDHVAIAVQDLETAVAKYVDVLNGEVTHREDVPSQGVEVCFVRVGSHEYELIAPLDKDSNLHKFLLKRGEGMHHVAFKVDDIEAAFQEAKDSGLRVLQEAPVGGARNKRIFFIHPKDMSGVLTEICQPI